ncbi:MAG: hypothetical protein ACK5P5_11360 [Pseudobdellovibrionaceae bacterium]
MSKRDVLANVNVRSTSKKTPKRVTQSIKKDVVNPSDYLKYQMLSACEDCSHFDEATEKCTLGSWTVPHRRAQQMKDYELSGKIAFCRLIEID